MDAAIACGVPHGGWCPKGRMAEDGPLSELYQLRETAGASYLARTEKNVKVSDGTVIFTLGELTGGSARTANFARRHGKPWKHICLDGVSDEDAAGIVRAFIDAHDIKCLNIAGSSASKEPGIYGRVFLVICEVFVANCGVQEGSH